MCLQENEQRQVSAYTPRSPSPQPSQVQTRSGSLCCLLSTVYHLAYQSAADTVCAVTHVLYASSRVLVVALFAEYLWSVCKPSIFYNYVYAVQSRSRLVYIELLMSNS